MSENWLDYWKTTLRYADIKPVEILHEPFTVQSYSDVSTVEKKLTDMLWVESGKKKDTPKIEILLCPAQSPITIEMQQQKSRSLCVFWIPALLDREGRLFISKSWNDRPKTPFFVRDCLTPNPEGFYVVGSEEDADQALKQEKFDADSWSEYWKKCERAFKEVSGKPFEEFNSFSEKSVYVELMPLRNLSGNVLKLYDHLIKTSNLTKTPLLKDFLNPPTIKRHYPDNNAVWLNSYHIGQFNGEFPLADSQRVALRAFTDSQTGDILAVNGPPGTGKTTLLQSVIANLVVQSVLDDKPPPLILASSTNNQAITNILNGFSLPKESDLLTSRWLPNASSLGLYMSGKEKNGYLMYDLGERNRTMGFFADYENTPVEELEKTFLEKAAAYLDSEPQDTARIKDLLRKRIILLHEKIRGVLGDLDFSRKLANQLTQLCIEYGGNQFDDTNATLKLSHEKINAAITNCETFLRESILKRKELPLLDKLLPFLSGARHRRATLLQRLAAQYGISDDLISDWSNDYHISEQINLELAQLFHMKKNLSNKWKNLGYLKKEYDRTYNRYTVFLTEWDKKFSAKLENLYQKTGNEYRNLSSLADLNIRLDISYRHEAFWLALHYREADYLERLRKRQKATKMNEANAKLETCESKMQRFACLTPLFISTFHSAPKYSRYYDRENQEENYYYNLYDYLIVDEAGQVAPDISIPTFSLAKTALVVGDTKQIEPVWSVTSQMDGVLYQDKIGGSEADWEAHEAQGRLGSSGSTMKMAQNACRYQQRFSDGLTVDGLLLTEHRRCLDSLISYCNDYVYSGSLKPMRGNTPTAELDFIKISRSYVHIDYPPDRSGKSYYNKLEAEAIAEWIDKHAQELCEKYSQNGTVKPLEEIIAVVTPYKPQAAAISKALRDRNKTYGKITVGTVHTLQGAERPIVLFSSVLSPQNPQTFLNSSYNMLNVAVSRAKDYFVLFGNMNMLSQTRNTPLGNLYCWLTEHSDSELENSFVYNLLNNENKQNKQFYGDTFREHINGTERHQYILEKALEKCIDEIIIVSPFLSINAVNLLQQHFCSAVGRLVKVFVYYDYRFTHLSDGQWKLNAQTALDKLKQWGVCVKEINGIHSKTIIFESKEGCVLIEGSFNWLSAMRDRRNQYHNHEASILLMGDKIRKRSQELKQLFEKMSKETK